MLSFPFFFVFFLLLFLFLFLFLFSFLFHFYFLSSPAPGLISFFFLMFLFLFLFLSFFPFYFLSTSFLARRRGSSALLSLFLCFLPSPVPFPFPVSFPFFLSIPFLFPTGHKASHSVVEIRTGIYGDIYIYIVFKCFQASYPAVVNIVKYCEIIIFRWNVSVEFPDVPPPKIPGS